MTEYFAQQVGVALAIAVVAGAMMGTTWTLRRRLPNRMRFHRLLGVVGLVASLAVIWVFTLAPMGTRRHGGRAIVLVPFAHEGLSRVDASPSVERQLLNVALFVPLGVFLAVLVHRRAITLVLIGATVSILVEALQYVGRLGSSTTTDVLLNTVGTALGVGVVAAWTFVESGARTKVDPR